MHQLRTFINGGENSLNAKGRQFKLDTYLAKLTLSKYRGPLKVSDCCKFTAAVDGRTRPAQIQSRVSLVFGIQGTSISKYNFLPLTI